ncbi:hypothetical protein V8E52_004330 [Russula decolorans]
MLDDKPAIPHRNLDLSRKYRLIDRKSGSWRFPPQLSAVSVPPHPPAREKARVTWKGSRVQAPSNNNSDSDKGTKPMCDSETVRFHIGDHKTGQYLITTFKVVKMVECLGCGLTRTDPFFVGALDFPDHLVLQFCSCLAGRGVKDISERTWCNFTHCYIIQPRIGESGECGFSLFACTNCRHPLKSQKLTYTLKLEVAVVTSNSER